MSKLMLVAGLVAMMCGTSVRAQFTDSVVARVQDEIITAFEVYEESQRIERSLRAKLVGKELADTLALLRNQTAVRMIEQELIYAEFQTLGVEVPGNLVQQRLDRYVKSQAGGDRAKFEELIEEQGLTTKEFEAKLSRALAIELLVREKVRRGIDIGPTEVKAYYEEHRAEFVRKERVRLQTVVIKSDGKYQGKQDETVAKVLAELAAGKPFGEIARTYSEGPFADKGGDRGWQEATAYPEELRGLLAGMTPGSYSKEPLKMGQSTYVLRLAEKQNGGEVELDADIQARISDRLSQQEEKTRYRAFVNELRRKYFVKVFDRELSTFWDSL